MRNLRNRKHDRLTFQKPLSATAWDASDDSIIVASGPNENHTITLKRIAKDKSAEDAQTITSWDAPPPNPDLTTDRILDLHAFPDTKTLTLILAGGDIVIVREDPGPGEDLIEIVGSVDEGIKAASWSPDEEVLAIATGAEPGTLLFMTREFESLANITLAEEDLKVSAHVDVGWGKRETQFKGRGAAGQARGLRDPTVPEFVDEGKLSELDEGGTSISWRGDGEYVALNSVLEGDSKRRVIRVYSREGTLESVSEPVDGLEGALSWKPSGQLIAGVRRTEEKIEVVFFERNGLRHGEFDLRLSKEEMTWIGERVELKWNTDSTVLAVSMADRVQLWTMGNYHYYLKQEVLLDLHSVDPGRTIWHPEKPLHLNCFNGYTLHNLSYNFEVNRGPVTAPHDIGLVAVIDGNNLKMTPLRIANVPPPMAFDEVELPDNALDVAISDDGTEICVLHHESFSIWSCDYGGKSPKVATLKSTHKIKREDSKIVVSETESHFIRTDHDTICYTPKEDTRLVDVSDGTIMEWRPGTEEVIIFQLTDSGILEIDSAVDKLRIPGCTSFVITPMHLIYTTSNHLLKFIHLHPGQLSIPPDEPEKDERCRSIERGAKIVTVIPSAYSLVLQMPRGNLETIYPRALVLAGIRQSLRDRDYKKAFLTCRAQRVDMNILHDYAPEKFMADVAVFVKQVKKVEFVDLFLSSLSEEDVSKMMYRETVAPAEEVVGNGMVSGESKEHADFGGSKMNRICDAFLRVLQTDSTTRLQNIVTAHVCKNPPDLESGLRLVSDLRKAGAQDRLEQAVEHVCFLADVHQLYDTALGLYDLDVALLVAQQSQKDPREYLPYLQSLHDMQTLRQRFSIDNDLKHYTKALTHLHQMNEFDELKSYMTQHELYAEAIDLYRYDNTRITELMRLYADYLSSFNRFKEAGIAYEYISDHASAYEAFRAATMWRECLYNASLVPVSAAELTSLAQDLAGSLGESKNFTDAAQIHLDYLNDLEGSARLLCKAYNFSEAMRLLSVHRRQDLLKQILDPGLIEAAATITELLAEMKTQLQNQLPRLRELRLKKDADPMAFLDGAEAGDRDVPDNLSLAPTDTTAGNTFMTRYTNRSTGTLATNATRKTSKNRRREERKRARGKKGTVYEEEYLVNSVARLVQRLNDVSDDVSKLIEGLMRRAMRERAVAVQGAIEEVREAVQGSLEEVFSAQAKKDSEGEIVEGEEKRPWGGEGVLWDALTSAKREAPMLESFERLSLIPR